MDTPPANPKDRPVIEMTGVTVGSLQDLNTQVLEDVNWTVAAGEYWLIAGMHGSGKSDLLCHDRRTHAAARGPLPAVWS